LLRIIGPPSEPPKLFLTKWFDESILIKRAGIEHIVAQKLVSGSVKLVRASSSHDIDLTAAGAAISAV